MRQKEKEFNILKGERPKVLLLGNGVCRAYGGFDWNKLLDEIKEKEKYTLPAKKYHMPMPIKAALLSGDELAKKMASLILPKKDDKSDDDSIHWENFVECSKDMKAFLVQLLDLDFDYVFTTNYSYELEVALLEKKEVSHSSISNLMQTVEREYPQTKYLLNTFNNVIKDGKEYNIWHIHGEARKPGSMIIGHNYYGRILSKIVERLTGNNKTQQFKTYINHGTPIKIGSWVDAFILGDVYILGLGLGFSETDLWWLLDQKHLLREISGETFYFKKKEEVSLNKICPLDNESTCIKANEYIVEDECQQLLMDSYNIHIVEFATDGYKEFYECARKYIFEKLGNRF